MSVCPDKPGDGTSKSLIVLNPRLTLISLSRFVEIFRCLHQDGSQA